jgi:F0F1-type ATP synthase assembly protein I
MSKQTDIKSFRTQLLEFSGIAFEMLIVIGLFVFIGFQIDKRMVFQFPIATVGFCLLGFAMALYIVFKRLQKK